MPLFKSNSKKTKIKIALTAEFLNHHQFTGIEKYLYNLIHSIAAMNRVRMTLICKPHTKRHLLPENSNIYIHKALNFLGTNFLSSIFKPPRNLENYDIVHAPTVVAPFFFNRQNKKRFKVVMTVHDLIPLIFPEYNIWRRRIYFSYILKYRLKYVDHFITPSNAVKSDLIRFFNKKDKNISVIYEGVGNKYFSIDRQKKNYILAVSTLEPRKNFESIIKSFILLKKNHRIKEKLLIVGKAGWLCKNIYNIPAEFNNDIIFTGYVSEQKLIELYQRAKLFIYPSFNEGFGLPVIEAMACGCPVMTSNLSSLPEVAGDAAFMVNPHSLHEITAGMQILLSDKKLLHRMKEKGLRQANLFKWNKCAEETITVYEKVLGN